MPTLPSVAKLASMALLTPTQQYMLGAETRVLERALGGKSMPYDGVQSAESDIAQAQMSLMEKGERETFAAVPVPEPEILRDALARNQETIRLGSPPQYTQTQRNELWRMAKELKEKVRRGMPSYEQLERPTQENLDVFMRHQERTIKDQLALRNIIRILDPSDETVVLETVRPHEPSHVNWEEWYGNFDQMYFSGEEERALEIQTMDPEIYQRFLALRLRGVETPKLLMRTLNISQVVYEACRDKLEQELLGLPDVDGEAEEDVAVPARARVPRKPQRAKAHKEPRAPKRQAVTVPTHADDMSAFVAAS